MSKVATRVLVASGCIKLTGLMPCRLIDYTMNLSQKEYKIQDQAIPEKKIAGGYFCSQSSRLISNSRLKEVNQSLAKHKLPVVPCAQSFDFVWSPEKIRFETQSKSLFVSTNNSGICWGNDKEINFGVIQEILVFDIPNPTLLFKVNKYSINPKRVVHFHIFNDLVFDEEFLLVSKSTISSVATFVSRGNRFFAAHVKSLTLWS